MANNEYFSKLNYTLANEDTGFERSLVKLLGPRRVASVCGSGGRAFPLLSGGGVEDLYLIDLVKEQLWLAELRERLFREVSREEFLKFMGLPPFALINPIEREQIFQSLKLRAPVKEFFLEFFNERSWQACIYEGKWENTFQKISKIVQFFLREKAQEIFKTPDLLEQQRFMQKDFPKWAWVIVLSIVGNASFFNALLYKGSFVKKNIPESYFNFYKNAYSHLFHKIPARENFFLQLSLLGKVEYAEGVPVEAAQDCYNEIKTALRSDLRIHYIQDNLIDYLEKEVTNLDFISLSDVPSYFEGETERDYLQRLKGSLNKGAWVVLRSYLRVPEATIMSGFKEVTNRFEKEIAAEKTQMYKIQVFERLGS